MIKPTVGRVVYYKPRAVLDVAMVQTHDEQPLRADIIAVSSDTSVNLDVIDAAGNHFAMYDVFFAHNTTDETTPDGGYAYWMPYQKGQAAKTEAAEAALKSAAPAPAFGAARKVPPQHIAAMLDRITFTTEQPAGTTATLVHAFLDGTYYLATGFSACVVPSEFNADLGIQYATRDATNKATDKLWELEGYLLRARLSGDEYDTLTRQPEFVARVAHEVNRAYCRGMYDEYVPAWKDAPQWQKDSAMLGVQLHTDNPDASEAASHESWMAQKVADGWTYGPNKDPVNKKHPCMVPYKELPPEQQVKDYLFRGVVHALVHDKT